ncbi:molybdopterin cofactor-binding domain-containing protein [Bosea sp. Root381]|uniref:molybdopterin cofactor-binding domain-containing protein n=1 Tax=Bosea sp. Root381 TaxID=1736524 RepID=UPI001FCDBBF0|nr:molybdopterin cofactor-binding domain-containing protein [Bosea sp. Root381]
MTYRADGTASVASATSDIGPGTYTVMTMIAAEFLGIDLEKVSFELGDTRHLQAEPLYLAGDLVPAGRHAVPAASALLRRGRNKTIRGGALPAP